MATGRRPRRDDVMSRLQDWTDEATPIDFIDSYNFV